MQTHLYRDTEQCTRKRILSSGLHLLKIAARKFKPWLHRASRSMKLNSSWANLRPRPVAVDHGFPVSQKWSIENSQRAASCSRRRHARESRLELSRTTGSEPSPHCLA